MQVLMNIRWCKLPQCVLKLVSIASEQGVQVISLRNTFCQLHPELEFVEWQSGSWTPMLKSVVELSAGVALSVNCHWRGSRFFFFVAQQWQSSFPNRHHCLPTFDNSAWKTKLYFGFSTFWNKFIWIAWDINEIDYWNNHVPYKQASQQSTIGNNTLRITASVKNTEVPRRQLSICTSHKSRARSRC
jgi:hypothetical protein